MTQTKSKSPKVSIIIVNYNGLKWLEPCLNSIKTQTYKNLDIIIVDNASIDGSVDFLQEHFPDINVIKNDENQGFAGGNNDGLKYATGEYIYLLNNDTLLEPNCVEKLASFLDNNPRCGSVQSKMVLMNDPSRLDVVGAFWTKTGFLYYYGAGAPADQDKFNVELPVYSNKGASMMLRKSAIDKVGLFDGDFWCYYEEGDLCARLWLAGYECWYEPHAVMRHAGGGTALTFDNSYIQFHNFKNKLMSFIKCHETSTLLKVLPVFIPLTITISFVWLLKGRYKHFLAIQKAYLWNIIHLSINLKKRKQIQAIRTRSDKDIFAVVKRNPSLSYFKYLMLGGSWVYED